MNRNAGLINADDMHGYAANSDSGTGRPRGFTDFGPPEAAGSLREIATQFPDFGMVGATTTKEQKAWRFGAVSIQSSRLAWYLDDNRPDRIGHPHLAHQPRHL
ncbi:MAG TPA: hypothetical protein VJ023_03490 [Pyrinomonadaceae bacterium]|nr:hypothetical protein [Pyrinomonadaceae bacterium]